MNNPRPRSRKAVFPDGRLGVRDFCARAGISYSEFYARYRFDLIYQQRWDIREDEKGRLNMSAAAADAQARISAGRAVSGLAGRFVKHVCVQCRAEAHARRKTCRTCGGTTFTSSPRPDTPVPGGRNAGAS